MIKKYLACQKCARQKYRGYVEQWFYLFFINEATLEWRSQSPSPI